MRYLRWIKASAGSTVRLTPVEPIHFIQLDTKYALVVWQGGEALIRKNKLELAGELVPMQFLQIRRSAIVNLYQVQQFSHGTNDGGEVQIKGSGKCLLVSHNFVQLFRQC